MKNKILIISLCREKMHEEEFVRPIVDILGSGHCLVKHYSKIEKKDLENAKKIILSGTSLQDFQYLEDIGKFNWPLNFDKPVLGICAGMQVLVKVFGGILKKQQEIGVVEVKIKRGKEIFGFGSDFRAYTLHNLGVGKLKDFHILGKSQKDIHIIQHKKKEIFGVMFHPEVLQKGMLREFVGKI
jgi:GMP synthase (glutamine-hydrolysing)